MANEQTLDTAAQKALLATARQTVEEYVKTGRVPAVTVTDPQLELPCGAFVTLHRRGQLRGCIGLFSSDEPLWKVVQEMAVAAATQDHRFSPVTERELPEIEYEISVLSPLRQIKDWREIKLGVHGVQIARGGRRGVFLPQVATETGWDLDTFMGELCSQKAGLPPDAWKNDPNVKLFVFTAQVFHETK